MEMKCDLCNGTGRLLENWFDTTGALTRFKGDKCFMCGGKGKVDEAQTKKPKTNFEDITSSPERLADFIYHQLGDAFCFGINRILHHRCLSEKDWLEWLKQEAK